LPVGVVASNRHPCPQHGPRPSISPRSNVPSRSILRTVTLLALDIIIDPDHPWLPAWDSAGWAVWGRGGGRLAASAGRPLEAGSQETRAFFFPALESRTLAR